VKAIYVYNAHSAPERAMIERAQQEVSSYIEIISMDELPDFLRQFVRTTPALIPVTDDLQGEELLAEGTDGKLLMTAILYKRLEEEEAAIHQAETRRLDNMIRVEKAQAVDDYTLELIHGGVI